MGHSHITVFAWVAAASAVGEAGSTAVALRPMRDAGVSAACTTYAVLHGKTHGKAHNRLVGWLLSMSLVASTVLSAAPTSAQQEAPQEAIDLYRSGREHYDAGRYREAIVDLKAALALDPTSPNLIYNVARVSELLGNLDEAIAYYTRYVAMLPDSESDERDRIRASIRRLEGARSELSSSAAQQPETLREVVYRETPPSGTADALFWIVGGAGVALLAGSAVTGVLALVREDQATAVVIGPDESAADRQRLIDQANTFALATDLMLVGGVVGVVTATVLYFARSPSTDDHDGLAVRVNSDGRGASLHLSGAF